MTHQEATQIEAVDKYLLNEMTPQVRDEFEEHFFDCLECSTDLRATAAFIDGAKQEFKNRPVVKAAAKPAETRAVVPSRSAPRLKMFWRPAVLTFALAASLLVIAYQNVVVYPHYKSEIAQLEAPVILPTVSLIGANSRGASNGAIPVGDAKRIQLVFEIPTQDRFTSYESLLYAPSGALLGKVQISSQAAKDTITMDAPTGPTRTGTYHLVIKGHVLQEQTSEAEAGSTVQDYPFALSAR
jgi:hypothetical protein